MVNIILVVCILTVIINEKRIKNILRRDLIYPFLIKNSKKINLEDIFLLSENIADYTIYGICILLIIIMILING